MAISIEAKRAFGFMGVRHSTEKTPKISGLLTERQITNMIVGQPPQDLTPGGRISTPVGVWEKTEDGIAILNVKPESQLRLITAPPKPIRRVLSKAKNMLFPAEDSQQHVGVWQRQEDGTEVYIRPH